MPREVFEAIHAARCAALRAELAGVLSSPETSFVLEIGCGNGHFLTAYAAAHSDQRCVGIDLRLDRIHKALRKRDRAGLRNLHFVRCAAGDFLGELPANARLQDIYILFPDPWPKKRHHKNRLLTSPFLATLATRVGQGGSRLFFRTDYQPYYSEVAEIITSHPAWQLLPAVPFPFEHQTIFQSRATTFYSLAAASTSREASTRSSKTTE